MTRRPYPNPETAAPARRHGRGRLAALAALAAVAAVAPAAPAAAAVVDRIVVRVNDEILTLVDYQTAVADRQQAILAATDVDPATRREALAEMPRQVVRELYEELLLLSRADQLGVEVDVVEVEEAVRAARERMGVEDDADFARALAASGLTVDQVRERMRKNLLVQRVVAREIQAAIEVEDEELRRIYRERQDELVVPAAVRLQEVIVLAETVPDREERLAAARQVVADLAAGATLESLAADPAMAGRLSSFIDLGWVEAGDLAPELDAAVWDLAVGEYSEPIDATGGAHVLQVLERREAAVRPYEEVKDLILAAEREQRMAEEYGDYLREVERQSYVVMDLPPEAAGFTGLAGESEEPEPPSAELEID
jgi:peptidyl-prolyl cis-trans isomerase SurA